MTSQSTPFTVEQLLAHSAWLKRLAAGLVEPAAADDLVQDTWLAALRSPPSAEAPAQPWLTRVVQNLARNRRRRAGRWRARAPLVAAEQDAPLPSAEELLTYHESQRLVAELVTALDEPYRSTVLLCYGQGLSSAEVAARQGIAAGTVRWRVKKGLDDLRSRLDTRYGGDRRGWSVALAPLAAQGAAQMAAAVPAAVMAPWAAAAPMKMAVGAVGVVGAVVGLWAGMATTVPEPRADGEGAAVVEGTPARAGVRWRASPGSGGPPASGVLGGGDDRRQPRGGTMAAAAWRPGAGAGAPSGRPAVVDEKVRAAIEVGSAPTKGDPAAPVTVVMFSSYQCPFSAKAQPVLGELMAAYPGQVRLVAKMLPLAFQENAMLAAEAALAAKEQGKFWQMHDRLFANHKALGPADLEEHARAVGLDLPRFRKAMEDKRHLPAVEEDMRVAKEANISGTPVFFINGVEVRGALPIDRYKAAVDEALAVARGEKPGPAPATPAFSGRANPSPEQVRKAAEVGRSPVRGKATAAVTMVMYAGFQCPFSAKAQATIAELRAKHGDQLRVVAKQLVLPFHENGGAAARAALAAHEQGKYWEMHDRLFANQQALDQASLEQHAQALGLDMDKFRAAMADDRLRRVIEEDATAAGDAGIRGTPTFLVNGKRVNGAHPERLGWAVAAALARASGQPEPPEPPAPSPPPGVRPGLPPDIRPTDWPPPRYALPDELLGEKVRAPLVIGDAPTLGPARAPVEVFYLNDVAGTWNRSRGKSVVNGLRALYGETVRIIARPVAARSPESQLAAAALWAAHAQGKFWELHDRMSTEAELPPSAARVEEHAAALGMDVPALRAAMASERVRRRVAEDTAAVADAGLLGRPTFVINGRNAASTASVVLLIEAALRKAGLQPPPLPPPVRMRFAQPVQRPEAALDRMFLSPAQMFHLEKREEAWAGAMEKQFAPLIGRDLRAVEPSLAGATFECRATLCQLRWRAPRGREALAELVKVIYRAEGPLRRDNGEEAWYVSREMAWSSSSGPPTTEELIARFRSRRTGFLHSLRTGRIPAQHLDVARLPAD